MLLPSSTLRRSRDGVWPAIVGGVGSETGAALSATFQVRGPAVAPCGSETVTRISSPSAASFRVKRGCVADATRLPLRSQVYGSRSPASGAATSSVKVSPLPASSTTLPSGGVTDAIAGGRFTSTTVTRQDLSISRPCELATAVTVRVCPPSSKPGVYSHDVPVPTSLPSSNQRTERSVRVSAPATGASSRSRSPSLTLGAGSGAAVTAHASCGSVGGGVVAGGVVADGSVWGAVGTVATRVSVSGLERSAT